MPELIIQQLKEKTLACVYYNLPSTESTTSLNKSIIISRRYSLPGAMRCGQFQRMGVIVQF